MSQNGTNNLTVRRKALGGKVEFELLPYRPLTTEFVIEHLEAELGDLVGIAAIYAMAVSATRGMTIVDEFKDEPEMARLAEYWQGRVANPARDFFRFTDLVSAEVAAGWYGAYQEVADTFLTNVNNDPEAASAADSD